MINVTFRVNNQQILQIIIIFYLLKHLTLDCDNLKIIELVISHGFNFLISILNSHCYK